MARDIAQAADRQQRPVRAMVERLDKFEQAAVEKAAKARQPIAEPPRIKESRQQADDAARAARRAKTTEQAAEALIEQIEQERPRGLIAWITGKSGQHKLELAAAVAAEREARATRKAEEQRAQALDDVRRSVERRWTDERSGIEGDQSKQAEEARRDLEFVAHARQALHDDPTLANSPQALQARVDELAEEARQALLERMAEQAARERQPDHTPDYGGPRR